MATKQDFLPIVFSYLLCIAAGIATMIYLHVYAPDWAWLGSEWSTLWIAFLADCVATVVIFVFSRIYKNSSFYDAYWSVIPPLLLIYWMAMHPESLESIRAWLVVVVVWFWGIRLTTNWSIHWPGMHHEDWRYPLVRQRAGLFAGPADFLGIHLFPTVQVFLGCIPAYLVITRPESALGWLDALAFMVGIGAVLIEMISDIQLHRFIENRKPGQLMDQGLWGWSRHPNYFGEISFWVSLTLFGLAVAPDQWLWVCIGSTSMIVMFVFVSVPFLDKRSLERRPEYAEYMKRVSALVPLPPKKH